jgi:hypothetical protein
MKIRTRRRGAAENKLNLNSAIPRLRVNNFVFGTEEGN